jgi:hypothetical protein
MNMKLTSFRHGSAVYALVLAAAAVAAKPAPPVARKEAIRTLEAIHIEGEIPVPQVLFITARDSRRFRDGLGHRYQIGALELARSVSLPDRLRVVQPEKP